MIQFLVREELSNLCKLEVNCRVCYYYIFEKVLSPYRKRTHRISLVCPWSDRNEARDYLRPLPLPKLLYFCGLIEVGQLSWLLSCTTLAIIRQHRPFPRHLLSWLSLIHFLTSCCLHHYLSLQNRLRVRSRACARPRAPSLYWCDLRFQ